jgi:hypothetical protein
MQPFRLFGGARRGAAHPAPADDTATVRDYTHDITQACIDLIDLPLDHDAQQRVIDLLLHRAPAAEQALARLEDHAPAAL